MTFLIIALLLIGVAISVSLILFAAKLKRNIANVSNEDASKEGLNEILRSIHKK